MELNDFVLYRITILAILIFQGCQGSADLQPANDDLSVLEREQVQLTSVPTPLPDPHNHVVDVNEAQLDLEDFKDFQVVLVVADVDLERENETSNPSNTFIAFSTCDETACKIFFEDVDAKQLHEIQGLPLSHRPFSDLVWITDNILVFDRWSQPYHGIHYAVDVSEKKLLLASPFPDQ